MDFDWIECILYSCVAALFAVALCSVLGDHKDPCDTPENKLTADYLVCRQKVEQANADAAALTTIIVATAPSTY